MKKYYLIRTSDNEWNSSYKKICDTLEEAKKEKQEWEKQEKGEFIIEWEEEKQPKEEEKQFEDSEFIIEW